MVMHERTFRLEHQSVAASEAGLSPLWAEAKTEHASSCTTTLRQGSFALPELPGFDATMNPSDSCLSPMPVMVSRHWLQPALSFAAAEAGLPGSWLVCQHPPSPLTPENSTAAFARCFTVDCRLRPIREVGRSQVKCNEAVLGSRIPRYGWRCRVHELRTPGRPDARRVRFMVDEQLPWLVPFN